MNGSLVLGVRLSTVGQLLPHVPDRDLGPPDTPYSGL